MRRLTGTKQSWLVKVRWRWVVAAVAFGCGGGPPPAELRTPRVTVDAVRYARSLLVEAPDLGLINDLVVRDLDRDDRPELLVVGTYGAVIASPDGAVEAAIGFQTELFAHALIDDSLTGFFGSYFRAPRVAMLDREGRVVWSADDGTPALLWSGNDAAVPIARRGDSLFAISPSGEASYLGSRTYRRVRPLLGIHGQQPSAVLPVPVEWADGSSSSALITSVGLGKSSVRSATDPDGYTYMTDPNREHVMTEAFDTVYVITPTVERLRVLPTPFAHTLHVQAARRVALHQDGDVGRGFATLMEGRGGWHRTVLSVHTASAELVYQEILGDDYNSIVPVPDGAGFFVGGRGQVWRYDQTILLQRDPRDP